MQDTLAAERSRRARAQEGTLSSAFVALARPERLEIISVLLRIEVSEGRGMSIKEICEATGYDRFVGSRHLRFLVAASLVTVQRDGLLKIHRLALPVFEAIEDWVVGITLTLSREAD